MRFKTLTSLQHFGFWKTRFQASTSGDFERYSRRRLALTSTFCFERYALRSLIIFLQQLRLRNMDFTIFDVLQAFHEVRIFEHSIQICSKQNWNYTFMGICFVYSRGLIGVWLLKKGRQSWTKHMEYSKQTA